MSTPCPSENSLSACNCFDICCCAEYEIGEECWWQEDQLDSNGLEGGKSTISWQHFPPSTSTVSRCDDSDEARYVASLPESCSKMEEAMEEEEQEKTLGSTTLGRPLVESVLQMNARHYLKIRHIFEFYNFLIGHLVCSEPDDPIEYLREVLDRCLGWRDYYGEAPLLVNANHLKSLFNSFDVLESGSITVDQYLVAMENIGITKGITPNNLCPPLNDEGKVDEEFFMKEGERCLTENLRKMLRIPKSWEEDRATWEKVMLRRGKDIRPCSSPAPGEQSVKRTPFFSSSTVVDQPKMSYEPEQLFL